MEVLALQSAAEDLSKKERRRKEKRSQRHEHCLARRRSLRPARRRRSSRFFPTLSVFRVCSPAIFASKLSVQLLRGTENTCRYMDRCGYQQTKKNLCSKMPPTANLRIFLHKPIAGSLTWTVFPRGWVLLVPHETFLQKRKVRSKKTD